MYVLWRFQLQAVETWLEEEALKQCNDVRNRKCKFRWPQRWLVVLASSITSSQFQVLSLFLLCCLEHQLPPSIIVTIHPALLGKPSLCLLPWHNWQQQPLSSSVVSLFRWSIIWSPASCSCCQLQLWLHCLHVHWERVVFSPGTVRAYP